MIDLVPKILLSGELLGISMFLSVGDALFKNAPHNVWFYWYEKSFNMGIYLGFQIFLTVQDKIAEIIPHNVRFPFIKIFHCEEVS